jgi:hypothetical protein
MWKVLANSPSKLRKPHKSYFKNMIMNWLTLRKPQQSLGKQKDFRNYHNPKLGSVMPFYVLVIQLYNMMDMPFIPEYWKLNRCMVCGWISDKVRKVGSSQIWFRGSRPSLDSDTRVKLININVTIFSCNFV